MSELTTAAVDTFLNECSDPEANSSVSTADLYEAYRGWCSDKGSHPLAHNGFGRDVQAARPDIVNKQKTVDGKRGRHYFGLRLRAEWTMAARMGLRG